MLNKLALKKPLIGITTGTNTNRFTVWLLQNGVRLAGGEPLHINPTLNIDRIRDVNGLLISGGGDIDPSLYQQPNIRSTNIEPERDTLETECIEMAYESQLPILGICRGAQLLNVVRGGTLHQDAPLAFKGFIPTESTFSRIVSRRKIDIDKHSRLARIVEDKKDLWVNSLHHQAQNKIGTGLRVVACDQHGITQAIESETPFHFVLGVQWHPEFMLYSTLQRKIFKALVAASLPTIPNAAIKGSFEQAQKHSLSLKGKAA